MRHSTTSPSPPTHHFTITIIFCLLILLTLAQDNTPPTYADQITTAYQSEQIIVKVAPGVTIDQINTTYGTTTRQSLSADPTIHLLQIPAHYNIFQVVQAMRQDPQLVYAELNFVGFTPEANLTQPQFWGVDMMALPSDMYSWPSDMYSWPSDMYSWLETHPTSPLLADLRTTYAWELMGSDSAHYYQQPAIQRIKLDQAQTVSRGSGVIIAVLDTGVDLSHPLLMPHLLPGYDFVDDDPLPQDELSGQDNDGDGLFDEVAGHGTHITGIVHLVAPQAKLLPLRVLNSDGQGDSFNVAAALLYAAEQGATVVNMSLGTMVPSQILQDALAQVTAAGVVVVAAAGNMNDSIPLYPAAHPCALGVTSVFTNDQKSDYASYGTWVDLSAPGERIYSTYPNGRFAWWQGTSMAAPFVSGQVALLQSVRPTLTLAEVGQLIAGTAAPIDNQNSDYVNMLGDGRINTRQSLDYLISGVWPTTSVLQGC